MVTSEGPNSRRVGMMYHLEKMLQRVCECSLGAIVTSWLGRSEN